MITRLSGFANNVVAVACGGRVTRADYEEVLVPAVDAALEAHAKLRLYYEIHPSFSGMDAGALWEDFSIGFEHLTRWERVAVVSDTEWVRIAVLAFRFLLPGRVRVFAIDEAAQACVWIEAKGSAMMAPALSGPDGLREALRRCRG